MIGRLQIWNLKKIERENGWTKVREVGKKGKSEEGSKKGKEQRQDKEWRSDKRKNQDKEGRTERTGVGTVEVKKQQWI